MPQKKPVLLVVLDGWGYRAENSNNAIAEANTPNWDSWWDIYPHTLLEASGTGVGLPACQMGNSEVGHMHIGAGRTIFQDLTRISEAILSKDFDKNSFFLQLIKDLKKTSKALHVMGLASPGGVHSHQDHLFAFLKLCYEQNFTKVFLHLFLDGRDTPPQSSLKTFKDLQEFLKIYPVANIASISGRYYAMDRDHRWERIAPVYKAITEGESSHHFEDAESAIEYFYKEQIYDEFIPPTIIGEPVKISEGDALFFFNFRSDRARQLTQAFIQKDFSGFKRAELLKLSHFISMTKYADYLPTEVAFPPQTLINHLGEVLAKSGLRQLRIAETEKYAHVTFFFNGGSEEVFEKEERILIPSPAVATYDLLPEMSAPLLTETIVDAIQNELYDVIICNYANADMVGHTGNFKATIQAIECLDNCLQKLKSALDTKNGRMFITADHGNAETMFDEPNQQKHTAHTTNLVPFICLDKSVAFKKSKGSLIDIAPTILDSLNLSKPDEMTGNSLLTEHHAKAS